MLMMTVYGIMEIFVVASSLQIFSHMPVSVSMGLHLLLYHTSTCWNCLKGPSWELLGRENRLEHATCGGKGVPLL